MLEQCRTEANLVCLPERQLDRKLYESVNKVLELLGGKWSRKDKAHVFEGDPSEALYNAIATESVADTKKGFQQFFTPNALADRLVRLADIRPGHRVLEPSAGNGSILRAIYRTGVSPLYIFAVEIDTQLSAKLTDCQVGAPFGCTTVVHFGDVADGEVDKLPQFDRVVMNPPFTGQQDIKHVQLAYECLAPGGLLVAVTSVGWRFREDRRSREFRDWLYGGSTTHEVEEGAFKESGTMVRTVIVTKRKPLAEEDAQRVAA